MKIIQCRKGGVNEAGRLQWLLVSRCTSGVCQGNRESMTIGIRWTWGVCGIGREGRQKKWLDWWQK